MGTKNIYTCTVLGWRPRAPQASAFRWGGSGPFTHLRTCFMGFWVRIFSFFGGLGTSSSAFCYLENKFENEWIFKVEPDPKR